MSDEHENPPPPFPHEAGYFDDPEALDEETEGGDDAAALEAAQKQIAELNDKVLRLAAEMENTRRRAEREKADAGRYAIANFARDMIAVADNFERAFQVAERSEGGPDALGGLIDGLKMTEKELLSVLERHGVRRVAAEREKFDPNVHQAVAQIPHAEIPSGHVVDVAQQGFTIGDRVLRAAMVTVSSGPGAGGGNPGQPGEPGERLDTKV
ncbi:nucleotide exchange factor GrpE [Hyphococcus sp.]|jgi:molecular chaperone GrpE|uniref:nucleotide exchange factor GrpE n=1 Tax=Hyphococcus sp. TaxID=2038636 RepID=UPI003D0FC34A